MGDWQIFSKNLRASLFNDDLSKEPNFGRIHLAVQYLYVQSCSTSTPVFADFFWWPAIKAEPQFLNFKGARESIPRNQFRQAM